MAAVTLNSEVRTNDPNTQLVNVTAAASGDTFESKFDEVIAAFPNDQTTTGGASTTVSGKTVTVNCTIGDTVDLLIWGRKR